MIKYLFAFVFFSFFTGYFSYGQALKPIGTWTSHMSYKVGSSATTDGNLIYCGTTTGLFTYNTSDNSISTYSTTNILNDVDIQKMMYSTEFATLIIVYENGNIDLISNGETTNIPFIKQSSEIQKTVNEIKLKKNIAYLSFGFGIVLLDIQKKEIADTYRFNENGQEIIVYSTDILENTIFAATENGLFSASLSTNLLDFGAWSKNQFQDGITIQKLFLAENKLVLITKKAGLDSAFIKENNTYRFLPNLSVSDLKATLKTKSGYIVFGQNNYNLLDSSFNLLNTFTGNYGNIQDAISVNGFIYLINTFNPLMIIDINEGVIVGNVKPSGPFEEDIFDLKSTNGKLWAVSGSHDFTYANAFKFVRIYTYEDGRWKNYLQFSEPSLKVVFDVVSVTVDPNNKNRVFMGSWGRGLITFEEETPFKIYNQTNSSLKLREALASDNWVGVGETALDQSGNLWVTNTYNVNALSVLKSDGSWKSFNFSEEIPNDETAIFDIIVDQNGYKWLTLPRKNEIIVFDDNGTIDNTSDDRVVKLSPEEGNGNIPGARGIKIEMDQNGLIWIGTSDGISVHNNPSNVFEQGSRDFDRIIFFDGENNEIVLQNTTIKDIAIDGENRKWVGTENSGVFLLSADAKETLFEFNEDNSPLYSNSINAIDVDNTTGEVFISTSKGLISYRGSAVEGKENFTEFKVFPNPIRPNYNGPITLSGLMDNSTVKITDINGKLVQEFRSSGGQVLWDGKTMKGEKPFSGIYLVFNSAENDEENLKEHIGKILFLR